MVLATEKLFLIVVAGAPSKDRADVQFLALDLAHHIIRLHAFGRILIMRAAGCMHVMITGVPMVFRGIDRSEEHTSELQSHSELVCRLLLEKKKCAPRMTSRFRLTGASGATA